MGGALCGGITANTRTSLTALVTYLKIFVAVIWVMGVIVLLAVFASSVNERKREFASLRIMGATRGMFRYHQLDPAYQSGWGVNVASVW